jgi:hypothetical protein
MNDNTAPTPDPATFAINPAGVSGYTISMTATAGYDASGDVEYYFEETSDNFGGTDSGWQSSATYSDYQLRPGTSYSYRVRMRDVYGNNTGWSGTESASTSTVVLNCGDWGYYDLDRNKDCVINLADFAEWAFNWLLCTTPEEPGCVDMR